MARLHRFLLPKNPDAARRAVTATRQAVNTLAAHPEIGRPDDLTLHPIREWFISFGQDGYVVRYGLDADILTILAVRHGREAGYGG